MEMSLNARPAWERLNHTMTMPNSRQRRLWNPTVGLWTDLASKLHERRWGVGCPNRQGPQPCSIPPCSSPPRLASPWWWCFPSCR